MKPGRCDSAIYNAFSCLIIIAILALSNVQADQQGNSDRQQPTANSQIEKPDGKRITTVRNIRHWSSTDYTRLVIDMDSDAEYEKHLLYNPNRIYFDIINTILDKDLHNTAYPIQDKFLKKIRIAQFRPDTVRVVLDFSEFSDCSIFKLQEPNRIIIDLHRHPHKQEKITKPRPEKSTSPIKEFFADIPDSSNSGVKSGLSAETRITANNPPEESKNCELSTKVIPLGALIQKDLPDSPTAAEPTSYGERTLTRTLGLKIGKIVLDPGHGGHDLGTVGEGGMLEKDLTLSLALKLKTLLEQKLGAEVILTRDRDVFVSLEERTEMANKNHADLFISIHANSSRSHSISGVETYYLDFAKTASEQEVAARENASAGNSISDLEELVKKITRADKSAESKELASIIQEKLFLGTRSLSSSTRNRGVRRAPFVVLIGANMPSILTEVAFISNPKDEELLCEEKNRNQIADALFSGIEDYVKKLGNYPIAYQRVPQK